MITMGIIIFNGFSVTNVATQFKGRFGKTPDTPTPL